MFNLLADRFIRTSLGILNLPEVLAALSGNEDIEFNNLRPHHSHSWHAFLTQLGAIAIEKDAGRFPTDPKIWTRHLLSLVDGDVEAWSLVREETTKPAFMQPAFLDNVKKFNTTIETADGLDILVTSKNFDVKRAAAWNATPDMWLYGLVIKQTMDGVLGRGYFGIARMNKGFGNRPCVSIAADTRWATRFRRDTRVWLEERKNLIEKYKYRAEHHPLLWMIPWTGNTSLQLQDLHPFFIEICRRLRLVIESDRIVAKTTPSATSRIDLVEHTGDTGDIWTPVNEGRSLTVTGKGFHIRQIHALLFSEDSWQRNAALNLREEDGENPVFILKALARGQGKTEGYHERFIPIPRNRVGSPEIANRSKLQITLASAVAVKILKPSLLALASGNSDSDRKSTAANRWLGYFDDAVEEIFFPHLLSWDLENGESRWKTILIKTAKEGFERAVQEMPLKNSQRYRCIALGENTFAIRQKMVFG